MVGLPIFAKSFIVYLLFVICYSLSSDVVVFDAVAPLAADAELVLPNRSAFYLSTVPVAMKRHHTQQLQLARDEETGRGLEGWLGGWLSVLCGRYARALPYVLFLFFLHRSIGSLPSV